MPQGSIYYALGRVGILQNNALDAQKLGRLIQAPTFDEARNALSEWGWSDERDPERAADEHVRKACALVRALTTDEKTVEAFLLRYDVNNLKILLKARALNQTAETLSFCGGIPPEKLRHAVAERNYTGFPPVLKDTLKALEIRLAVKPDPFDVDVTLDRALYEMIFSMLPKGGAAYGYFTARVDLLNAVSVLRALHLNKDEAFLKSVLILGGSVSEKEWLKSFKKPETLAERLSPYGREIAQAVRAAQVNAARIPSLERAADDRLLKVYLPYKRAANREERLIGYLLMRQREAAAVRLILAGKQCDFPQESIRERLRELYA